MLKKVKEFQLSFSTKNIKKEVFFKFAELILKALSRTGKYFLNSNNRKCISKPSEKYKEVKYGTNFFNEISGNEIKALIFIFQCLLHYLSCLRIKEFLFLQGDGTACEIHLGTRVPVKS